MVQNFGARARKPLNGVSQARSDSTSVILNDSIGINNNNKNF